MEENCKAKSSSVAALLEQADKLSLAEQKILLQGLFDKFWQRRIDTSLRSKVAFKEWKPGIIDTFLAKNVSDPQMELEYAYQSVQGNLIQLRQAVASSIAHSKQNTRLIEKALESKELLINLLESDKEKQNEKELEKIRERILNNEELLKSLHQEEIRNIENEKKAREHLRDAENISFRIYNSTQLLSARYRAASTLQRIKEILEKKCGTDLNSELAKFEKLVKEEELKSDIYVEDLESEKDLIKRSVVIIKHSTLVLERVEELLKNLECKSSNIKT
ncbi:MAG: hypothetical protein SFY67_02595 [Candidatus Melainabacteria bacterium]|nr:hypothetical protein [Candidatus Melainabacteria bacterium]